MKIKIAEYYIPYREYLIKVVYPCFHNIYKQSLISDGLDSAEKYADFIINGLKEGNQK
jgi:hypothetical protein